MTGHRTYLGVGSVRTAAHITTKKGHRTFTQPVRPPIAKEQTDGDACKYDLGRPGVGL